MNLVERFFAEITDRRIRCGVFTSVDELEAAIHDYLDQHNGEPSLSWGQSRPVISEKVPRRREIGRC